MQLLDRLASMLSPPAATTAAEDQLTLLPSGFSTSSTCKAVKLPHVQGMAAAVCTM
jgi:hypothetical protein